ARARPPRRGRGVRRREHHRHAVRRPRGADGAIRAARRGRARGRGQRLDYRTERAPLRSGRPARRRLHPPLSGLGAIARDPALRRVAFAFATFNVAEWATWIAMLVYAYERGGAAGSGLVAVVQLVPAALFAPSGAGLGDRFPRHRVFLAAYGLQAATTAATAAALAFAAPVPLVYLLAATAATSLTLVRPAQNGLLPSLVATPDALTAANAALGTIENGCILAGPALAGALLAIWGPALVFAVTAAALVAGALSVAGVRVAAWGLGLVFAGAVPSAPAVFALVVAGGAGRSLMDVTGRTLLQRLAAPDVLSRVFGVLEGSSMAALAIGALAAPVLVERLGSAAAFAAIGALLPVLLVIALPALRTADLRARVPER